MLKRGKDWKALDEIDVLREVSLHNPRNLLGKPRSWLTALEKLYKNLYNYPMSILSQLFSSKARVEILRALSCSTQGFSLRQIEKLTSLPVYSVQHSIKRLLHEKHVVVKKKANRTVYRLNAQHGAHDLLCGVFDFERQKVIASQACQLGNVAGSILNFNQDVLQIFQKKKR